MLPGGNRDNNKNVSEILKLIESILETQKEYMVEIAQLKALTSYLKEDVKKLTIFTIEGNGRPSLNERIKTLEEKHHGIEDCLKETELILTRIPERVSEIKEEVGTLREAHEGHTSHRKWIVGTAVSIGVALIPLLWQSFPLVIKWIELQKYTMQVYDQHLLELKELRNKPYPKR